MFYHNSIIAVLLAVSALASPASGATYYVSTGGSDGNQGTQTAPFKTISKAAGVAAVNDTVNVVSGTYSLAPFITSPASVTYRCTNASGNLRRQTCKLQPANGTADTAVLWENDGAGVIVDGFEVDGQTPNGLHSVRVGLYSSPKGTAPVTYRHNLVHHVYQGACNMGGAGLISDAYHTENAVVHFVANTVHDIGPASGCNTVHGIYVATDGKVINNLSWNAAGWGITTWHDAKNNRIANNTVFANLSGGISVGVDEWYQSPNPWTGSVINNISYANAGYGIAVCGSIAPDQRISNNLVSGNAIAMWLAGQTATATVTRAPVFVAYNPAGSGDYHLQAGSPGINQGTPSGAPTIDMDGVTRTSTDIGAYEYVAPPPSSSM